MDTFVERSEALVAPSISYSGNPDAASLTIGLLNAPQLEEKAMSKLLEVMTTRSDSKMLGAVTEVSSPSRIGAYQTFHVEVIPLNEGGPTAEHFEVIDEFVKRVELICFDTLRYVAQLRPWNE